MKMAKLLLLGLCVLFAAAPAYSHHSFPATYNVEQETEVTGQVVAFLYRNPHATIQVMVTEESGEKVRYLIEWAGATALAGSGVKRGTLVPGDTVVIKAIPGGMPPTIVRGWFRSPARRMAGSGARYITELFTSLGMPSCGLPH